MVPLCTKLWNEPKTHLLSEEPQGRCRCRDLIDVTPLMTVKLQYRVLQIQGYYCVYWSRRLPHHWTELQLQCVWNVLHAHLFQNLMKGLNKNMANELCGVRVSGKRTWGRCFTGYISKSVCILLDIFPGPLNSLSFHKKEQWGDRWVLRCSG